MWPCVTRNHYLPTVVTTSSMISLIKIDSYPRYIEILVVTAPTESVFRVLGHTPEHHFSLSRIIWSIIVLNTPAFKCNRDEL